MQSERRTGSERRKGERRRDTGAYAGSERRTGEERRILTGVKKLLPFVPRRLPKQ